MKKIFILIISIISIAVYTTCDDDNLYNLSKYGPRPGSVYIYMGGLYNGDLASAGGADNICRISLTAYPDISFSVSLVKAFISSSNTGNMKDIVPGIYGDVPVYGIRNSPVFTQTLISTSWSGLWDTGIDTQLSASVGIAAPWWSGSNFDGTYDSLNSCSGWRTTAGASGRTGNQNSTSADWLYGLTQACNTSQNLLCVAY